MQACYVQQVYLTLTLQTDKFCDAIRLQLSVLSWINRKYGIHSCKMLIQFCRSAIW